MLTPSPVVPGLGDRQPRILAVDDQPANLLLVKRVLEPAGFRVLEARSGAEALAVARESMPDLILLDMHLPDMHGLEVLKKLRESAWGAGLCAVAMSALSSLEDRALWMQAGFVGSIDKPIDVKEFVLTISRWLPGTAVRHSEAAGAAAEDGDPSPDRLGEILVANNLITPEQLRDAVRAQSKSGRRLGQVLVDRGDVSEDDIAWALSNQLGYPYVFLTGDIIDQEAAHLLPEVFLREHLVLPILKFGQEMTLAMADPTDQRTVDEVASRTRLQVKRALALASNIDEMLDRLFAPREGGAGETATTTEAQYLQFHLVQAIQQGASEIHLDPAIDGQARVRYRVQGVLVDRANLPAELHAAIIAHVRALVGAGESPVCTASVPVTAGPADLLLTATFLPTLAGPAATMTLYPRRGDVPDPATLGVPEEPIRWAREALTADRGMVLVGCAGHLLRSTLLHILIPPVQRGKAWSLELLPVYRRPTLNQTAIASAAEVAGYLRAAAHAEADLVMVDDTSRRQALVAACETARTRMILAGHPQDGVIGLLGHLLDVAGPALTASCLRGVLIARAVRLLCPVCKEATPARTFVPRGCEACAFTGFRGERVLVQTWLPDDQFRMQFLAGQLGAAYERIARDIGLPMRTQGLSLIEDGLSSKDEVMAALEGAAWT